MSIFSSSDKRDIPNTKDEFFARVEKFVATEPNALYLIDGQKGGNRSVICRQTANGGKTCLNLEIDGVSLFKKMQEVKFFCSLPANVQSTHFECRKIE